MFNDLVNSWHVYYRMICGWDSVKLFTHYNNKNDKVVNFFIFQNYQINQLSIRKLIF